MLRGSVTSLPFSVGAFSLKKKSPTITVGSFFLFQLTISLWMSDFLQFSWSTNCHTCNFYWHFAWRLRFFWCLPSRRMWVRVQPWLKVFLCRFFRLCDTFFAIFLCLQRVSFNFFLICKRMDVQKFPMAPFLRFSALCDLPETKKVSKKYFEKKFGFFWIFSSRGYCRWEYLTHWSPFAIFEP